MNRSRRRVKFCQCWWGAAARCLHVVSNRGVAAMSCIPLAASSRSGESACFLHRSSDRGQPYGINAARDDFFYIPAHGHAKRVSLREKSSAAIV